MTDDLLFHTIALTYLYRNRIYKEHALLEEFGDAVEVWKRLDEENMDIALQRADHETEFIRKHHISVYYFKDETYPWRLRQCPDAPILLYGKGNLEFNKGNFLAIVGTRNADERGKQQTKQLIADLHQAVSNLTIISGLAYGIDVTAHRAALEMQLPTIIVPGHGLDKIYPALHRQVAIDALENGGIATEFLSETQPDRQNFIIRNRIIAGMSDAVVVVESKEKGGSLITARCAMDYNRDVFAFPGRIQDENFKGCNQLIKKNMANLLTCADDIIDLMQWQKKVVQPKLAFRPCPQVDLSEDEKSVLALILQYEDGIHINMIIELSAMTYQQLMPLLMTLELKSLVKVLPGGVYMAVG